MNPIADKIAKLKARIEWGREMGFYFYLQPVKDIDGARILARGREMLLFASYSYLGLIGHPKIDAAAKAAIDGYGTGTHGVRILAGSLALHRELEEKIASFTGAEDSIVFSSGYVTNLATVSTLVGRGDVVISDKLNHASIVDGCILSRAHFVRCKHNDMADLDRCLSEAAPGAGKLVVADAVFSMDGDIIDLPEMRRLCTKHGALLMVDEAHSLGVLGKTGHGIEEHFGMPGAIDIKMGTLSKTIPSVGGYIAADRDTVMYLKHSARAFVFSAALPPAQVAAAKASLEVIEEEPWRIEKLRRNVRLFIDGLKARGFDTLQSETAIVPIICGKDERTLMMTKLAQERGLFVLPVLSPAVPPGTSRIRAAVTAAHTEEDIDQALDILEQAGRMVRVIRRKPKGAAAASCVPHRTIA
ncbi:MAG: aminotransferase class I/II-fold pyridoxal phosphate-dependent enzyme [Candidatus Aureabacteria bacterium]|nr:aminotransferase class I/II-fold pyridoxal phosphate-dependent enzyme [Candidatus Auribacterota bacterium]NLW94554.1 aminotransferase class I/II-fold pyridoxal phosphate-dependent enzyme [Chlamydiota bacterium]HOE28380.1 aminotransferase class I/II-fold pyridoxal phosphate-dependent enzyme [bacterium]HQM51663.1 aminotransferase class I/II-fold pyridoxal phosphate-dependent enzyme [bacterium]